MMRGGQGRKRGYAFAVKARLEESLFDRGWHMARVHAPWLPEGAEDM